MSTPPNLRTASTTAMKRWWRAGIWASISSVSRRACAQETGGTRLGHAAYSVPDCKILVDNSLKSRTSRTCCCFGKKN
uniref:Uncharacterized protein n=1 Tax=Arundo donax TaxID=35708 RepID=A0A0A9E8X0_ARUDO